MAPIINLNYGFKNVRAAAVLTNSYVAGTVMSPTDSDGDSPHTNNQLIIYVQLTIGNLTSADVKVEFSHDGGVVYPYMQECFDSVSAGVDTVSLGVHRMSSTGNYRLAIPIKDKYIKVSAIGNGDVTGSSMKIDAALGVV